jgi:hypothetical protein
VCRKKLLQDMNAVFLSTNFNRYSKKKDIIRVFTTSEIKEKL